MTKNEFLEVFERLKMTFEKEISLNRTEIYYQQLTKLDKQDFERVVQYCIRNLERFPSIASIYKAMGTLGVSSGKKNLRPIIPYIHYEDQQGRAYCLWNGSGESFNPPEVIKEKDGRVLKRVNS